MSRPGTQLLWTAEGIAHAHTDEEAAAGLWLPGGECARCPHNNPPKPALPDEVTRAERHREVDHEELLGG